jgi:hypothetical protein
MHSYFPATEANRQKLQAAAGIFTEIVTKREFPEIMTTYLNDSYTFWSFQRNKSKYVPVNKY